MKFIRALLIGVVVAAAIGSPTESWGQQSDAAAVRVALGSIPDATDGLSPLVVVVRPHAGGFLILLDAERASAELLSMGITMYRMAAEMESLSEHGFHARQHVVPKELRPGQDIVELFQRLIEQPVRPLAGAGMVRTLPVPAYLLELPARKTH